MRRILVGLIGQPNVGKSTLYNVLTRGNAIVTNWPGTTVERSESVIKHRGVEIVLVDLPGIYGLSYLTLEERITRRFITEEKPDLLVVLVDSLILERSLYLAIEVRELTGRVVIALTKIDEAHSRGIHINTELLAKRLGVSVVPVSAIKGIGLNMLLDTIVESAGKDAPLLRVDYGELEAYIDAIIDVIGQNEVLTSKYPARWLAVKFLEGDREVEKILKESLGDRYQAIIEIREEASRRIGIDIAAFTSIKRLQYVKGEVLAGALVTTRISPRKRPVSKILYNPVTAPIVSIGIILGVFFLVFIVNTGYPLTAILEALGYPELANTLREYTLSSLVDKLFTRIGELIFSVFGKTAYSYFIVEGVIGGVATVLTFAILVFIVMAILGALEDSGLLPRLAVGMHILLQRFGLSGHALLPLTLSMGCNVPGIMSTRAIPSTWERVKLILLTPFIPCQARLVVLLALAAGIGGITGLLLVPLVYLVSFTIVLVFSSLIDRLAYKDRELSVELLLEIPPLHRPYFRVIWWFTWYYLKHFIVKAGTVIFTVSLLTWILQHITPTGVFTMNASQSIIAYVAHGISPILYPLGITGEYSWIVAYAVIMGFLAKELVLSVLLISTGASSVNEAIAILGLSAPSLVSLALFIALYIPCLATAVTIYTETRSWKYVVYVLLLSTLTAYILAILAYTLSSLIPI